MEGEGKPTRVMMMGKVLVTTWGRRKEGEKKEECIWEKLL